MQQAATTVTYERPVTIPSTVPIQPVVTTSEQPQQFPKFSPLCTPTGQQFLNNYLLPIQPEWSDSEEEGKALDKQEEKKTRRRLGQYHTKTKAGKRTRTQTKYQENFKIRPINHVCKVQTPQLTDTLVGKTSEKEEQVM